MPLRHQERGRLFVHGSARNPLNEFVFPYDIENERKMERIFAIVEKYCFQGHTHIPGVFTDDLKFYKPEEVEFEYELGNQKTLINVGSVGQPRDGNPDACYVILNDNKVTFRRIEYDIDVTARKIREIEQLSDFLGERLYDGR